MKTYYQIDNTLKRCVKFLFPLLFLVLSANPLQAQKRGDKGQEAEPKLTVEEIQPVTPEAAQRYSFFYDNYISRYATQEPSRTRISLDPDLARIIDKQRTFLVGTPASDVRIVYGLKYPGKMRAGDAVYAFVVPVDENGELMWPFHEVQTVEMRGTGDCPPFCD